MGCYFKMKSKTLIVSIALYLALILTLSSCSNNMLNTGSNAEIIGFNMQKSEIDSLLAQVAEHECDKRYSGFLPDNAFASAEIFGIDKKLEKCVAYVYLYTAEYVSFKGKAYEISGSSGEVIIKFNYMDGGEPMLTDVQWSSDGGDHNVWMKDNFPKKYLLMSKSYKKSDLSKQNIHRDEIIKEVEKNMQVPVELNNLLLIDTQNQTYEIQKTIDKNDGTFEIETIEKGNLK